jgi:hypothetical protein
MSTEQTPLVITSNATQHDAAIARALTEEELRLERNKGTPVVHAEAWDDYAYSNSDSALRYGAWRGPNGEVIIYRDEPDVADPTLVACFWVVFLLFLLAIIILPFYL